MLASWYDAQGSAIDVMHVGELPDPRPGPGEVRIQVTVSGVNPGDTKKRRGWLGSTMPFPRVIPHSDAAGVVDAVGEGVDDSVSGSGCGCTAPSPTGLSARLPSTPSSPPTWPLPCPTTSVTSSGRAWAFPGSPPTAPCSPTARSTAGSSWCTACTACSAGSVPWPPSSRTGPEPPCSPRFPLEEIAKAHDRVDAGGRGRTLVTIPQRDS